VDLRDQFVRRNGQDHESANPLDVDGRALQVPSKLRGIFSFVAEPRVDGLALARL
jgi:hypothetical protein